MTVQDTTIHLRETAKEFIKEAKKNGFKGVRLTNLVLYGSDTNEYNDEMTDEEYQNHIRNYVIFSAEYDLEAESFSYDDDDNEYVSTEYDYCGFENDLIDHLQKMFGDDVQISHNERTGEFECTRVDGYSAKAELEKLMTRSYYGICSKLLRAACQEIHNKTEDTPNLLKIAELKSLGTRTPDGQLTPDSLKKVKRYVKNALVNIISVWDIL